jgi:hypothetical protein
MDYGRQAIVKAALALTSALLCIASLIYPQWFERVFDAAPDAGDGSLEMWLAAGAGAIACIALSVLACRDGAAHRRARKAAGLRRT